MMRRLLFVLTALLCFVPPAQALTEAHTQVDLLSETQSLKPGDRLWLGVRMRMDEGWHVYWKNPGDSGLPPEIKWTLPPGWKAGSIHWPVPDRIDLPPLRSYGYEHEVLFLVPIETSGDTPVGAAVELRADVSWLACQVDCIPGKGRLSYSLNLSPQASVENPQMAALFGLVRSHWPRSLASEVRMEDAGRDWVLHVSDIQTRDAYFFPEHDDVIQHAAGQVLTRSSNGFSLQIPKSNLLKNSPASMPGILKTDRAGFAIDPPVVPAGPKLSLIVACAFAFLGGLILNVMPCVLPVLSLKIIGLVARKEGRRESLRHGLVFAAGVLVSFWILAGILFVIKSAGASIGWGFQFQSPWFVGFMIAVFLMLALNLFGFFEIGLGLTTVGVKAQSIRGPWQDFWNGFLATVVATPCTAPFMGTAITFALSQPVLNGFLIFTSLGAGMALPMVLLTAFPSMLKFLPKPGPWMNGLKRVMGVFMLLSALWLGWVLALQLDLFKSKNQWRSYSPAVVAQLKAENKSYFLDFTAAWCLTCQVNDRLVLQNPKVVEKFKEHSIILLKADWTKHDPAITSALEEYGRNSIPLYVFYSSRDKQEKILGETISVQGLTGLLEQQ